MKLEGTLAAAWMEGNSLKFAKSYTCKQNDNKGCPSTTNTQVHITPLHQNSCVKIIEQSNQIDLVLI